MKNSANENGSVAADATRHLSRRCQVMRRLIREHGTCGLKPQRRSPFEALVRAVAHQQLNGTAAQSILRRFLALTPGIRFPRPDQLIALSDEALRSAGFSRGKIKSLRDIADKTLSGIVPDSRKIRRMSNEEIIERLTEVHGVGRWTVEMLLMFTLGRPDVLPVDDFGVRNGYRIAFGLAEMPAPKEVFAFGERWRPHRTTASWYLWRAADAARHKKPLKGVNA
jgi:DNA-3-methyladenine glycosylase II